MGGLDAAAAIEHEGEGHFNGKFRQVDGGTEGLKRPAFLEKAALSA